MMDGMSALITGAVALPFLIIALVFFLLWIRARRQVSVARGWPTTTGRVLSAEVEKRRSHSSTGGYSTSYYPVIHYEYQVNGKRYQNNRLTINEIGLGMYGRVQKKVDQYPPGSRVQVYYNPDDPYESVLETRAPAGGIYLFVAVLIVVILACTAAFTLGGMTFAGQLVDQFMPKNLQ